MSGTRLAATTDTSSVRAPVAVVALVLALSACGDANVRKPPHRLVAERLVVLPDGLIALAGIAASGASEDEGCRPGENAWDFFVARVSPRGRLLRTDVVKETTLDRCGDLVIDARRGPAGRVDVSGWTIAPIPGSTHGPVDLSFAADGTTSHSFETAHRRWHYGLTAVAETALPGGGRARMSALGYRKTLQIQIERPNRPAVRTRTRPLPANAQLYENWLYWYSLSADREGVYGSGPYTRGPDAPYYFPIFRHRLDGRLDRGFGGTGVVLAHPAGVRFYVTTQVFADRQGRALAVGGGDVGDRRITYVMRFRPDGQLDDSFGDEGVVRLPLGRATEDNYADTRAAIGVLPNGRIAVAGGIQARGSTLWLLHPGGTLDRSFGRNGRLVLSST